MGAGAKPFTRDGIKSGKQIIASGKSIFLLRRLINKYHPLNLRKNEVNIPSIEAKNYQIYYYSFKNTRVS